MPERFRLARRNAAEARWGYRASTPTTSQAARPWPENKSPESTPVATPALLPVSGAAIPDARYAPVPWWALTGLAMVCLGLGILLYRQQHRPE